MVEMWCRVGWMGERNGFKGYWKRGICMGRL